MPAGRVFGPASQGAALLVLGDDGNLAAESSPGAADGSDLPTRSPSTEEPVAAVGLEPGDADPGRHHEPFQDHSRSRIDPPQLTLAVLPGAVPEVAIAPGHAGDAAVGLDGAEDRPGLGIDLMDLPLLVLTDPE